MVEEEMATKAKIAKSYEVDYKAMVRAIQRVEKKLSGIKGKVSTVAQKEINTELEVMKKCEMLCGGGRKKMSKSYA
jgi:predicted DNA-binding protein YlxM (UPF0122 family)